LEENIQKQALENQKALELVKKQNKRALKIFNEESEKALEFAMKDNKHALKIINKEIEKLNAELVLLKSTACNTTAELETKSMSLNQV
jgi:hypothetical protein